MLIKLIRHEIKQTRFTLILIVICIAVFTGLGYIFGVLPAIYIANTVDLNSYSILAQLSLDLSMIAYVIVLIAIYLGYNIYLGIRYYKTMYSTTGYMTNTLPLTVNELILGKIIPGVIFFAIINIIIMLSGAVLLGGYAITVGGGMDFIKEIILAGVDELHILFASGYHIAAFLSLANLILSLVLGVLLLFLSVTIGQLFNTHRLLMSVVIYIGIFTFRSMFSSFIGIIFGGGLMAASGYIYNFEGTIPALIIALIERMLFILAAYVISFYIVKNKLNVE